MGAGRARGRRASVGDRGLIAAAAAALALAEAAGGGRRQSPANICAEALEHIERLSDAELARRLDTLYYLGWAENYLELYDDAIAHAERGVAIARATGEGRLLDPADAGARISLRDAGPSDGVRSMCETAVESARLVGQPALPLLGAVRARLGALLLRQPRRGDRGRARRARGCGGRLMGGHDAVGRRRAGLGARGRVAGDRRDRARLRADATARGGSRSRPGGAVLQLGERRAGAADAGPAGGMPSDCAEQAEELSAGLDLQLPVAIAARTRAAVLLAAGDAAAAAAAAGASAAGARHDRRRAAGRLLAQPPGSRARRGREAAGRDRRAA